MTHDELVIKVFQLETRINRLESSKSLYVREPEIPDGWCQICGMNKNECLHRVADK